jgi:AcrR family transcriptional regulator
MLSALDSVQATMGSTMDATTRAAAEPDPAAIPSRHELVLDEAARQLNRRGVLLTSLGEIAAKLGVSRSAMYYYVDDRDDLVFQCYRRAADIIGRHFDEASGSATDAAGTLRNFIARMLDPNEPEIVARAEISMTSETQRAEIHARYDALVRRLAVLIETGRREGAFRDCDVEVNARVILSLLIWAPLAAPWALATEDVGPTRLLAAATATIFDGLATDPQLPQLTPIDLAPLAPRAVNAFDRNGAIEAKREALVRVASRLFNQQGIDSTSLDAIAAQLGTTKRTLHHHLGSKQELVSACYDRTFRMFFYIRDRMTAYAGSRLQALAASTYAFALAYSDSELSPLSPIVGFGVLSAEGRDRFLNNSRQLAVEYWRTLEVGMEEGSMQSADVQARVLMLPGLLSWLVKGDVPSEPAQRAHIAREIANLVAVGLAQRH